MNAPLKCYLTDHLSGAALAIRILKSLRANYRGSDVGQFADALLREILADEAVLVRLNQKLTGGSGGWKRSLARLFSHLGAGRLVHQKPEPFGAFEAMETLAIGIQGKRALWSTLRHIAEPRFAGANFEELIQRASAQHADVEAMRLSLASRAFIPASH